MCSSDLLLTAFSEGRTASGVRTSVKGMDRLCLSLSLSIIGSRNRAIRLTPLPRAFEATDAPLVVRGGRVNPPDVPVGPAIDDVDPPRACVAEEDNRGTGHIEIEDRVADR